MEDSYISFDQEDKVFHLHNDKISYLLKVEDNNVLNHLYFGKAIKRYSGNKSYPRRYRGFSGNVPGNPERGYSKDTLPQEYSSHGSMDYRIPASIIRRENGSNIHDLRYFDYKIEAGKPNLEGLPQSYVESDDEASTLIVTLKDRFQEIYVDLYYTIYHDRAVIARSVKVDNKTDQSIALEKIASMQLDLTNNGVYDQVVSLPGAHMHERQINREDINSGIRSFQSRRGESSHQMNSFIALANHDTSEFAGPVIGLNFVYSGNHDFELEKDQIDQLRVLVGINPYNFSWNLNPGETFQTPEVIMVYSDTGFNDMSRTYHHLLRERVARGGYKLKQRPIVINNWEATFFDFTDEKIERIVDEAANLGIEMFVLDDGWFGHRNTDNSSLGDWFEYKDKLLKGLKGMADYVHQKGMKFGLWFEPEMISVDSKLYREHPDYLMQEPNREPSPSRDQFVLDMGRKEVRQNVEMQMTKLLDSVDIDYVKWDMNRNMSDVYSLALNKYRQGEASHRYILGVYELMDHLTTKYQNILWEGCSGGGGRFDAGLLYYMPQSWTSDNTDAVERMKIQYGTSLAYPVSSMTAHVSAVPNQQTGRVTPLKTRGDVAMSGVLGYELDLTKLTADEKIEIKRQVAQYKKVRQLVQYGDYIRLKSPFESNIASWMFVNTEKTDVLMFVGRILSSGQPVFHEIFLKGLNPDYQYRDFDTGKTYFGDELMNLGIYIPDFEGDFQSKIYHFKKI